MKKLPRLMSAMVTLGAFAVVGLILLITGPVQAVDFPFAKPQKPRPTYIAGEVLVKFKPTATSQARSRVGSRLASVSTQAIGKTGVALLKLSGAYTVEQAVAAAHLDPNVEYAQPNYLYYASVAPNDPNYGQLWGLKNTGQTLTDPSYGTNNPGTVGNDINAEAAWDHITDCSAVVVAVLDTGINYTHQDLAANMWDGGVAFPNHGFDFIDNDNVPFPTGGAESHGTHVAGTVGARGNNALGTTGVCWQVRIMSVRVLGANGSGSTAGVAQGIEFASDNSARVINMSLGFSPDPGDPFDQVFSDAITYAQDRDVVVVVAAGNEVNDNDGGTVTWPCNFTQDNLVCVAALDQAYALANFSNFGVTSVDVGAPGANITSSYPGPIIEDDFSTGWIFFSTPGGSPWANISCDFGSGPFPMLVNPSTWCSGGQYSDNTTARVYKEFDLSGVSAASASYAAFLDVQSGFDFARDAAFGGGGNPFLDPANVVNAFSGSTLPSAPFVETDLSGCLTTTCSVGFELDTDGSITGLGVGVLAFEIGTVQSGSNAINTINGTSMASPHVAGLAALVRAFNPNYTYTDTVNAIKNGGRTISALSGFTTTGKAVDALGSLAFINVPQGVAAVVQ